MSEKKKWRLIFPVILIALSLQACAVRREADGFELSEEGQTSEEQMGKVFRVEQGTVEYEEIIKAIFNMTMEEINPYVYEERSLYQMNGTTLSATLNDRFITGESEVSYIAYWDENEAAATCYGTSSAGGTLWECLQYGTMRQHFPKEELDDFTKEEAIEACRPYAEAWGYGEAKVSSYAVTVDILREDARREDYLSSNYKEYSSAPVPGFEMITYRQFDELQKTETEEEIDRLIRRQESVALDNEIPWEKKHEAIILTYQPSVENYFMQEDSTWLNILYVPLYQRPIKIAGYVPYRVTEVIDEQPLIAKEQALGQIMLMKGYTSAEEMEIRNVSLVYGLQYVREQGGVWEKAIPCWSVEYLHGGELYTVVIDAIYGDEYTRSP